MNFGYNVSFLLLDKGIVEYFGPTGLAFANFSLSNWLFFFQSGFLFHYNFVVISIFSIFMFFLTSYFLLLTSVLKVLLVVLAACFLFVF